MNNEILQEPTSEEIQNIIITDNPEKVKNILDIDTTKLSKKELLEFSRKDLTEIAKNLKVLGDLKEWKIKRLTINDLVKRIKDGEIKQEVKEDKKASNDTAETKENAIDIVLLQSAIIDLFTKKDATNLDVFCAKTVQNNNSELIAPEVAEKLNKSIVNLSIVHLTIRSLGGYTNIWQKAKDLYKNYKEKKVNNAN